MERFMANNKTRKTPAVPEPQALKDQIEAAYETLPAEAREEAHAPSEDAPAPPDGLTVDELNRLWNQVNAARRETQRLKALEDQLKLDKREVVDDRAKNKQRENELERERAKLVEREAALAANELNAEHGFSRQKEQMLTDLQKEATGLRAEIHQLAQERRDGHVRLDAEVAQLRATAIAEIDAEIAKRRDDAGLDYDELVEFGRESARQRKQIEAERATLDEDLQELTNIVNRRVEAEHGALKEKVSGLEEQVRQARASRDETIAEAEIASKKFVALNGREPEAITTELNDLRTECEELRRELALRPSAVSSDELEQLRALTAAQGEELVLAQRAAHEAKIADVRELNTLTDLELQRERIAVLEATSKAYVATINDQKQQFEDLVERQDQRSPFEQMTLMDESEELHREPPVLAGPGLLAEPDDRGPLAAFVRDIQARMIFKPLRDGRPLYYTEHDLRIFLAGLATSKLQILQGISGTGKTSLPLAFARAIAGESDVIEVQAGWRDRQDLLGHYNTFERRYDETDFVQALYRAQMPAREHLVSFVVLDEMNLSHPEQYFADLLSALELDTPQVTLTNAVLRPFPVNLGDGRILKIPDNVWFIGTANHDETTMGFADKTYDRAHVQELPFTRTEPEPDERARLKKLLEKSATRAPIDNRELTRMFEEARKRHEAVALDAAKYLRTNLAPMLNKRFGVGWANRFDEQLAKFVPVVIDAGGSVGEAIDHLLVTKILRKVRGRHDIAADNVKELSEKLTATWDGGLDPKNGPEVSLEILEDEERRLRDGLG
jgi:hypothetical protein